jgi:hypothetical protein
MSSVHLRDYPKIHRQIPFAKTMGELRIVALTILKEFDEVPDRASVFINGANQMNFNWYSVEDMETHSKALTERIVADRKQEALELKARLLELETLGL